MALMAPFSIPQVTCSPVFWDQTCPQMHSNPYGHPMAVFPRKPHHHHLVGLTPCNKALYKHDNDVFSCHWRCFHQSKRLKLCQDSIVIQQCSKLNKKSKSKTLLVLPGEQGKSCTHLVQFWGLQKMTGGMRNLNRGLGGILHPKHWVQGTILSEKYPDSIPNVVNILH